MKEFVIEVLYPEFNNLYGDSGNIDYLVKKLEKSKCSVKIINTNYNQTPAFVNSNVDFLYIGPCTESKQEVQISKLKEYEEHLLKRINSENITLATGNAFEIFGQYIKKDKNSNEKIDGLAFFDYYSERFNKLRYNDLSLGEHKETAIVGFKNQLSHSYPIGEFKFPFLTMEVGSGMNPDINIEGVNIYNFYATYLIGPLLALNPEFTNKLLSKKLGKLYVENKLPFEDFAFAVRTADMLSLKRKQETQKKKK